MPIKHHSHPKRDHDQGGRNKLREKAAAHFSFAFSSTRRLARANSSRSPSNSISDSSIPSSSPSSHVPSSARHPEMLTNGKSASLLLPEGRTPSVEGRPSISRCRVTEVFAKSGSLGRFVYSRRTRWLRHSTTDDKQGHRISRATLWKGRPKFAVDPLPTMPTQERERTAEAERRALSDLLRLSRSETRAITRRTAPAALSQRD
jgi:hypothetical protein